MFLLVCNCFLSWRSENPPATELINWAQRKQEFRSYRRPPSTATAAAGPSSGLYCDSIPFSVGLMSARPAAVTDDLVVVVESSCAPTWPPSFLLLMSDTRDALLKSSRALEAGEPRTLRFFSAAALKRTLGHKAASDSQESKHLMCEWSVQLEASHNDPAWPCDIVLSSF